MNKIHKTVWSAAKGAYVVVSENTKSKRVGSAVGGSLLTSARTLAGQFVLAALSYSVLLAFAQPVFAKTMAEYNPATDKTCFYDTSLKSVICGSDTTEVVPLAYFQSLKTVVLGDEAKVKNDGTIAVGAGAQAMSRGSLAVGINASAGHVDPPGTPASAAGTINGTWSNIAIGDNAYAHGMTNISIGESAGRESVDNWNFNNVNVGTRANYGSVSGNTVAIGNRAGALTTDGAERLDADLQAKQLAVPPAQRTPSVYIGKHAGRRTVSYGNIAVGYDALKDVHDTLVKNNIAIGNEAGLRMTSDDGVNNNDANSSLKYGTGANVLLGNRAGVTLRGDSNVAVGNETAGDMTGDNNIVMGNGAARRVTANRSIIMGIESGTLTANHDENVLIGHRVNAGLKRETPPVAHGVGIGSRTYVTGDSSIAIGYYANAGVRATNSAGDDGVPVDHAIAIGERAVVKAHGGTAIGSRSRAYAENATAIGRGANATAVSALAVGESAVASAEKAISVGKGNKVNAAQSIAVGTGNVVDSANAIVLGNSVTIAAGQDGAVVLGNDSTVGDAVPTSSAAINGVTYGGFAGATPVAGDVVSVGASHAPRQIQNVAAGRITETSTDAINGSQLYSVANKVSENANAIAGNTAAIGELSGKVDSGWNLSANGGDSSKVAADNTVDFSAEGDKVVISKTGNSIKIGLAENLTANGVQSGDTTVGENGLTIANGPSVTKAGIDAGDKKVTNVAAGDLSADSKDAVTGGQLFATNETVAGHTSSIAANTAAIAGNTTAIEGNTAAIAEHATTIAGHTDSIAANAAGITNNTNAITALSETVGKGWNLTANGQDSTKIAAGDTVDVSAEGDKIVVSKTGNTIKIGLADNLTADGVQSGDTTVGEDGLTIANGPSVTKAGIDAGEKKVANVAAGDLSADSKDAVTGGQLFATNEAVAGNKSAIAANTAAIAGNTTAIEGNTAAIAEHATTIAGHTDSIAANAAGITNNTNAITTLSETVGKGWNLSANGQDSSKIAAGDTVDITAEGDKIVVSKTGNSIKIGLAQNLTADGVQSGDTTVGDDGLTIANGPSVTKAGIDAADKKVTDVAAGDLSADSKDAVTGGQLFATNEAVAGNKSAIAANTAAIAGNTTAIEGNTASIAANTATITAHTNELATLTEAVGKGWNLSANGQDSSKIAAGDTVDITAEGDKIVVSKTGNTIKIGLAQNLTADGVQSGDTTVSDDGLAIANGPSVTKAGIDAADKKVTGVAAGDLSADSKDAVTGAQLFDTNEQVAGNKTAIADNKSAIAGNAAAIADHTTAITNINNEIGKGFKFGDGSSSNTFALGDTINVKGDGNVLSKATADGVQLSLAKTLNVGDENPVTVDGSAGTISGLTNVTFDANATYSGGKAATQEQLQSVYNTVSGVASRGWNLTANGADSSNVAPGDAVDFAASDSNIVVSKSGNGVKFGLANELSVNSVVTGNTRIDNNGLTIAGGPSVTSVGINAGGTKVTNVAAGTDLTDAVNVGQLREVQNLASAGWKIGNANGVVGQVTPGSRVNFVAGNNSTRVTVTQEDGVSRVEVSAAPSPLRYTGAQNVSSFRARESDDPFTPTNEVTLYGADPDAPVSLNNVAKAKLSADSLQAVNGGQVFVLGESVANSLGGDSVFNPDTGKVEASLNVNGKTYNNVNDALNNIGAAAGAGWNLQVNDDTPELVAPGSVVGFKAGENIVLKRDGNNITVSALPAASTNAVNTEFVSARDVEVSESVGVIDGPTLSRNGIDAAGTTVSNVAPGKNGTDAVNVNQLNSGLSQLDSKIQRYKNEANGGTAAAMAMAGLPQAYLPGKSMFAIGGSTFQGQGGYAAGLSTVTENGKWVIKGTVAGSTRGQVGGSVGVGYQW